MSKPINSQVVKVSNYTDKIRLFMSGLFRGMHYRPLSKDEIYTEVRKEIVSPSEPLTDAKAIQTVKMVISKSLTAMIQSGEIVEVTSKTATEKMWMNVIGVKGSGYFVVSHVVAGKRVNRARNEHDLALEQWKLDKVQN